MPMAPSGVRSGRNHQPCSSTDSACPDFAASAPARIHTRRQDPRETPHTAACSTAASSAATASSPSKRAPRVRMPVRDLQRLYLHRQLRCQAPGEHGRREEQDDGRHAMPSLDVERVARSDEKEVVGEEAQHRSQQRRTRAGACGHHQHSQHEDQREVCDPEPAFGQRREADCRRGGQHRQQIAEGRIPGSGDGRRGVAHRGIVRARQPATTRFYAEFTRAQPDANGGFALCLPTIPP